MKISFQNRTVFFIMVLFLFSFGSNAQSYNSENTSLSNFVKRLYENTLFEGVKLIQDYDNEYLISVLTLDREKYSNPSIMFRVSKVKAQSQLNTFLNGSIISEDFIVNTTEIENKNSKSTSVETFQQIKENSIGFVNEIELMINFESKDGSKMVFIYGKKIANIIPKN